MSTDADPQTVEAMKQRADKYLAWERGLTGLRPPAEGTTLIRDLLRHLAAVEADLRNRDAEVAALSADLSTLRAELAEVAEARVRAELRASDIDEQARAAIKQAEAERDAARARETKDKAKTLRDCATEIENSLANPVVSDRELLQNCINWYRAQADNLDPPAAEEG